MEPGFGVWGSITRFVGMCKGRTRVFHMSVNPVISTRRVLNRELKKIGFLDFLNTTA